jgi:hypothetical protein
MFPMFNQNLVQKVKFFFKYGGSKLYLRLMKNLSVEVEKILV